MNEVLFFKAFANFAGHIKLNGLFFFLTPFQQLAFKIKVAVLQGINIEMKLDDAFHNNFSTKLEAFVQINGTDKCLKGIAIGRFEHRFSIAVVIHQFVHTHFLR